MARRNSEGSSRTPTLVDVVFFTPADAVSLEAAQAGALQWLNANAGGDCGSRADDMFPTPVSASGEWPAIGYVCNGEYTPAAARSARIFIEQNRLPVAIIESDLPAFLASHELNTIDNG